MVRCADFYKKWEQEPNWCEKTPGAVSQINSYLDLVKEIASRGLEKDLIYEKFPERAARVVTTLKNEDGRADLLNYIIACLKRDERIMGGDLKKFTMVNNAPPKTEEKLETIDVPSAPIAPLLKEKYGGKEQSVVKESLTTQPAHITETNIKIPSTAGQPIKPEHGIILTEAYCRAKKCENLKPCKERGNRIECFPAGAEPRHMNECPLAKRERLAQEGGFTPAGESDPITGGRPIKLAPVKITKAPMEILCKPSPKQQEFIERMVKSGEFETPEEVVSEALDTAMLQEGGA